MTKVKSTVIDTLRFADRLKEAGVPSKQAEAMARAFNDELTGGLVTQASFDSAVAKLRGEIQAVDAKVDAAVATLRGEIQAVDAKLRSEIQAVNAKLGAELKQVRSDLRWLKFMNVAALAFLALIVSLNASPGIARFFGGAEPPAAVTQNEPLRSPEAREAPTGLEAGATDAIGLPEEVGAQPAAVPPDQTGPPPSSR